MTKGTLAWSQVNETVMSIETNDVISSLIEVTVTYSQKEWYHLAQPIKQASMNKRRRECGKK
jgi:hypothetical protein